MIFERDKEKFLGVIVDRRMIFDAHTGYVIKRDKKKLNILRCIGGVRKGACSSLW